MPLKYLIFYVFYSISLITVAQQLPLTFTTPTDEFTAFSNSGFAFAVNPQDSNDSVGQFFNDGSSPWQGFFIDMASPVDLSEEQTMTLDFYQFDSNTHTITIKLENGTDDSVQVTQTSLNSGWDNGISFDFSEAIYSDSGISINATGTYSRITLFIDGGLTLSGTYLVDDLNNGSEDLGPNQIDIEYTDLVWSDEFEVDGPIDSNNWYHQTEIPRGDDWFNGEVQHYTDRIENSFVENGFLNIVAIKEDFNDQGVTKEYTSARLNSKFAFTYGRVDVRAKLPLGDGTWPAIWTLGKNVDENGAYWETQGFGNLSWPACGELDIMEHGIHSTNEVSSAVHTPSSFGNTINTETQFLPSVANNFHVYSMNWSPDQITFLIDGEGYYTYNPAVKDDSTWPFDLDQYLILNIAMGGIAGTIDPNFVQSAMVLDYVRVYQNLNLSTEDKVAADFKIYPNPASNRITIQSSRTLDKIELYNPLGQLVLREKGSNKQLDVSNLRAGLYVLRLYSENQTVAKKIIIN